MKLLITGASGYIGEHLIRYVISDGKHDVIAASRKPLYSQIRWIPFDFLSVSQFRLPEEVDVVFHLAATTDGNILPDVELAAASHLLWETKRVGAKMIFVSSQTARENAPTVYGRVKWQIEKMVLVEGGWVIRPGQVYGGSRRALFGTLVNAVKILPVIPIFIPSPKIQPIHVKDLAIALLNCAESDAIPSSILCVGAIEPISFTHFLYNITVVRLRCWRVPLPTPVVIIRLLSHSMGKHLQRKFGLERLNSLFQLPIMDTKQDLQLLKIFLRPLSSGMTLSGDSRRRDLLLEGRALLIYILKTKPHSSLMRRYVRSIETIKNGHSLNLPRLMIHFPVTIALLDSFTISTAIAEKDFIWRLNAAMVIAEASIQGAKRFLAIGEVSGFFTSFINISGAVTSEVCWRVIRLITLPLLKPILRHLKLLQ